MYQVRIQSRQYDHISLVSEERTLEYRDQAFTFRGVFDGDWVDEQISIVKKNNLTVLVGEYDICSSTILGVHKQSTTHFFRPLDKRYPNIAVSSCLKQKYSQNLFVVIHQIQWKKTDKWPTGEILHVIGPMMDIPHIQEAWLRYHEFWNKYPKLNWKHVGEQFNELLDIETPKRVWISNDIISIDPEGCQDIDDAYSVSETEDEWMIQIHISDVASVLRHINYPDPENISSVYSEKSVFPMIHPKLSTNWISLKEHQTRLLVTVEIRLHKQTQLIQAKWYPSVGRITRNESYDECGLDWKAFGSIVEEVYFQWIRQRFVITDSHTWIEALMILYNVYFAEQILPQYSYSLFRTQKSNEAETIPWVAKELRSYLRVRQSEPAEYSHQKQEHHSLAVQSYCHMTSPIRRLADLINQQCVLELPIHRLAVQELNEDAVRLKRMNRSLDKLVLAASVFRSGNALFLTCFVVDWNIDKRSLLLYFPTQNLTIWHPMIKKEWFDLPSTQLEYTDSSVTVYTEWMTFQWVKYMSYSVSVTGKPNWNQVDESIHVEWNWS